MNDFTIAFSSLPDAGEAKQKGRDGFDFQGDDLIRKAYEFGLYLDILPGLSFDQFITQGLALRIHSQKSLYDIKLKKRKLIGLLGQHLLNHAYEKGRIFLVDWKWSVSDYVDSFNAIVENIDIELETEYINEVDDSRGATLVIGGKRVDKTYQYEELNDLVDFLNELLEENNHKKRIYLVDEDPSDTYTYILLEESKTFDVMGSEFFDIYS